MVSSTVSTKSLPPPPIEVGWGANLQTNAAKIFLLVSIPAKVKKLGLLSIYKFSLGTGVSTILYSGTGVSTILYSGTGVSTILFSGTYRGKHHLLVRYW